MVLCRCFIPLLVRCYVTLVYCYSPWPPRVHPRWGSWISHATSSSPHSTSSRWLAFLFLALSLSTWQICIRCSGVRSWIQHVAAAGAEAMGCSGVCRHAGEDDARCFFFKIGAQVTGRAWQPVYAFENRDRVSVLQTCNTHGFCMMWL
ncbi:hypothetical protein PAHAL_5G454900 [Panicum hallii]|uniref:Uncharacterized protein n=1 Tax=Panicum hallii TaxID=206008 RepID=A0A2S3HXI3_9POAL|nr:hypothetical protein PAHAL_5G454900 [Panicum hallii]